MVRKKQQQQKQSAPKTPQPRKEWHPLSKIIEKGDYNELETRAKKVIADQGLVPSTEARDVFGNKFFAASESGDQSTYYSKLRAFVKFHLKYPDYDIGIAIFYPFTPHHTLVGCDKAASHFLLMQFAAVDEEVIDFKVRDKYLAFINILIFVF